MHIIVKAPGKVLLTGGYLILERNDGVSVSTKSKFTCELTAVDNTQENLILNITSKLYDQTWNYEYNYSSSFLQNNNSNDNKFIISTVQTFIKYIQDNNIQIYNIVNIVLYCDNEFYTFNNVILEGKKTGLGSSSALTVSLMVALYSIITPNIDINSDKQIMKLVYDSYLLAQNNKGSGFDILTSLFGNIIFHGGATTDKHTSLSINNPNLWITMFHSTSSTNTRHCIDIFREWRINHPGSSLWSQFVSITNEINSVLIKFLNAEEIDLSDLRSLNLTYLNIMCELSTAIGIDILPQEVYNNILAILKNNNNIYFISIPGSGGYDAYYCIGDNNKINMPDNINLDTFMFHLSNDNKIEINVTL